MLNIFDDYLVSENAQEILKDRYFAKRNDKYVESTWSDVARRVARYIAAAEGVDSELEDDELLERIKEKEEIYYELINKRIFLPNSPTLFNAGEAMPIEWFQKDIKEMSLKDYELIYESRNRHDMLSACFVSYTEDDSMEGIFDYAKKAALILKYGGGVGYDFSVLRPKGALVHGTSGYSSGPISFMQVYNATASTIQQGGKRRAAQMAVMRYDHPDIMDFINSKKNNDGNSVLSYFNISVNIDDPESFLDKYEHDDKFSLVFNGQKYKEVSAREFLDIISKNAWGTGDPGLLFLGRHNKYYANSDNTPVTATNPCFAYNEKLLTDKGEISIGELDGQTVMVWSPFDKEFVKSKVFKTGTKNTITLKLSNGKELRVTPDHKVYDAETLNWKSASNMLGRKILYKSYFDIEYRDSVKESIRENSPKVVEIVQNDIEPVYDFSMEKTHAGVVNGLVCHNCGEEPLPNHGSCNLGSLNVKIINEKLPEFYKIGTPDFEKFKEIVGYTIMFLDDVVTMNVYPLEEIEKTAREQRFLGLGIMGFADMLYNKRIPYDSKEARNIAVEMQAAISYLSHVASSEIAKKKGNFFDFDKSKYPQGHIPFPLHTDSDEVADLTDNLKRLNEKIIEHFLTDGKKYKRNVQLNTIAPTGSISNLADVSSGLEPNFALVYTRFMLNKDGKRVPLIYINNELKSFLKETDIEYYNEIMNKVEEFQSEAAKVENYKEVPKLAKLEEDIMDLNNLMYSDKIDEKLKKVFVTAQTIKPIDHLYMQVAFQEYIDASVSKTINMPKEATVEDIKDIYLQAMKHFVKGITIYRDGSLQTQVLTTKSKEPKKSKHTVDGFTFFLDQKQKIVPKPRLETMPSITKKVKTQEGTTYMNITIDPENSSPSEIFLSNGHETAEIIGRLASISLRAGVSPDEIIKQLKKTKGTYAKTIGEEMENIIKDIPRLYFQKEVNKKTHYTKEEMKDMKYDSKNHVYVDEEGNSVCPVCGAINSLQYAEGCVTCLSCGNSKCL